MIIVRVTALIDCLMRCERELAMVPWSCSSQTASRCSPSLMLAVSLMQHTTKICLNLVTMVPYTPCVCDSWYCQHNFITRQKSWHRKEEPIKYSLCFLLNIINNYVQNMYNIISDSWERGQNNYLETGHEEHLTNLQLTGINEVRT